MTLVINYLEIENFKSYYGKNILGPFHQVIIIFFKFKIFYLFIDHLNIHWTCLCRVSMLSLALTEVVSRT